MTNRINRYGSTSPTQEYEEFFGGTLPCPSCRGSGRIARESENELVALIPVRDKRLKPSKTKWYVLLAVLVCLALGALLLFFLFPRTVVLTVADNNLTPYNLYINTSEKIVRMQLTNIFNISNKNFYGISIQKMDSQVFFDQKIMLTSSNKTNMFVPPLGKRQYHMTFNVTFNKEEGNIAAYCASSARFGHTLIMPFQTTMYALYLGRTEETTLTSYQHVRCSPDLVPTTLIPAPTIPPSTTPKPNSTTTIGLV